MALNKTGGLNYEGWLCILGYVAGEYGAQNMPRFEDWRDVYDRDYTPHQAIREHFKLSLEGQDFPWRSSKSETV